MVNLFSTLPNHPKTLVAIQLEASLKLNKKEIMLEMQVFVVITNKDLIAVPITLVSTRVTSFSLGVNKTVAHQEAKVNQDQ